MRTKTFATPAKLAALALATMAATSHAGSNFGGAVLIDPTAQNALQLAGRDAKFQSIEVRDTKIAGNLTFTPKAKNTLALAGRDSKKQSVQIQ